MLCAHIQSVTHHIHPLVLLGETGRRDFKQYHNVDRLYVLVSSYTNCHRDFLSTQLVQNLNQ